MYVKFVVLLLCFLVEIFSLISTSPLHLNSEEITSEERTIVLEPKILVVVPCANGLMRIGDKCVPVWT
ncbi:hypothetical protein QE152_g30997 [Popillia japonica]|uniref:Uncharacterized protein n=1 Tax=Popillia japonica TaxID=7064 RepID=A0AAW1JCX6_POPJA